MSFATVPEDNELKDDAGEADKNNNNANTIGLENENNTIFL